jgi:hypothetical protein
MAEKRKDSRSATEDPPSEWVDDGSGSSSGSRPEDWYEVSFSLPWIVKQVESGQDAINIAVSEVGKRVTPASPPIRNIDISVQEIRCGDCESTTDALLLVSKTALVGLLLTMEVQGATPEKAERIARKEIGTRLEEIPLTTVSRRREK